MCTSCNLGRNHSPKHEVASIQQDSNGNERHGAAKIVGMCVAGVDADRGGHDGAWNAGKNSADDAAESLDDQRRQDRDRSSNERW